MVSRILRAPPLGRIRLADVDDALTIMDLVNESMSENFRVKNSCDIIYLIENCVLSICHLDINDVIVGFLAAKDYPPIPSVHPQAWEEYIWTKYKSVELKSRNTLFLHMLCWNPVYARDVVDGMMKSMFMHDPYLQYICMIKPLINYPLLVPGQSRSEASFRRVQAMERGVPGDQLPALCIAERQEVSPRLRIRRAVEEDNDDIVPIIERQSTRLREIYGDFYVSELISRHPESERVLLVCEHKELAVGVMCLNTDINFESLEESFELSAFSGLRHLETTPNVTNNYYSFLDCSQINIRIDSAQHSTICLEDVSKDGKGKVGWVDDDENRTSRNNSNAFHMAQLGPYTHLDILNLLEDEEEELDFDIVNIDTELLLLPLLQYDALSSESANFLTKVENMRRDSITYESSREKMRKLALVETIHYTGPPNAFLLELFAMHPDYDDRYGFDMLEVAYELFPNREYCVLCLPSSHPSFPLLEHFTLVTSYGCQMRFINDTLYVAHVNSVRGQVSVRPGEASDIPNVTRVLEHAPRNQVLLELFDHSLTSTMLDSFVLLSERQPIGMVVLGPLEDGKAIRTQYDLEPEPRRAGTDGAILAGVMSPAFEPQARWYMRDLLRQTRYTTLFWICRLVAKGDASPGRNLMSLAGRMMPVPPRRSVPNLSGDKNLDIIFQEMSTPFALWVLERPLTWLPKVDVNNSIVVVGASRTGLAFLEALLMGPESKYLTFTNVTLVSEQGLPTVAECLRAADTCVPRNGRYSDRYLKSVPFYFYVDIMKAVVVKIDRQKKCIHLTSGGQKFYDELILTCGQQFQHPDYLKDSLALVQELQKGKPCERILMDNPNYQPDRVPPPPLLPDSLMLINSLYSANICLKRLMRMITEAKDTDECLSAERQVVVYGDCVEAYSCIAALLELGIAPEKITFVEPFPPEESNELRINCFNNETVDERVQASVRRAGVHTVRGYHLVDVTSARRSSKMRTSTLTLRFLSTLHAFTMPCFALFYYGLKAINLYAFKAINECGLVYDGGVVVGPGFETNDPHVYAAGTCVRYSRRLYASRRMQQYYCSEDVGEALAKIFLKRVDPFVLANDNFKPAPVDVLPKYNSSSTLMFRNSHPSLASFTKVAGSKWKRWQPVLKFESPIVQSATLPGPLYYMTMRKPSPEIPMEVQLSLPHQGHILLTDKNNNYFRLRLNVLHCVEEITCLSKKPFSPELLAQLYGKHEAFFNKLFVRFQMNLIDDLFSFFTQPWMAAIYQETFEDLLRDINEQDVGTVYDLVKSRYSIHPKSTVGAKSTISTRQASTCFDIPSCGFGPKEACKLGTFRSVIDKFVTRTSRIQLVEVCKPTDIPSECGQSESIRMEADGFWKAVGGEGIVLAHLARHLHRHNITNPHYALPQPYEPI